MSRYSTLPVKYVAGFCLLLLSLLTTQQVFGFAFGLSEQIEEVVDLFEDDDALLERLMVGRLEEDESSTWSIGLDRDRYYVAALCDRDCDDIDICVSTKDDTECDTDIGDLALVSVRGSDLEIEVDMYDCEEVYCYYAVLVFQE